MAKTPTRAAKTYRRHGDLPAYFQWRDGRPTWTPSQGLRDAGWRRHDLKDDKGGWLTKGAAIDRAALINDAVGLWREGLTVPVLWAAFAPAGSTAASPVIRRTEDKFSIGALQDGWMGVKAPARGGVAVSWVKPPSDEFKVLALSTQRDYANKLKRAIDVLAGYPDAPDPVPTDRHALAKVKDIEARRREWAAYQQAIADIRAEPIFSLAAEEDEAGELQDPLYELYKTLKLHAGVSQASGVVAVVSAWLTWCRKRRSRRIQNWAAEVERETPGGRVRPWSVEEFKTMVATADAMGLRSVADAMVLGLDLSWSQIDRLQLTWSRVIPYASGVRVLTKSQLTEGGLRRRDKKLGRAKTGRVGGTPLTSLGLARLAGIRERQEKMDAHPTHVLWCEKTGGPWKDSTYRKAFDRVRTEAAKACPSLVDQGEHLGVWEADLRDTAFTWMKAAGLSDDGIASRTLQGRGNIAALGDAHYGEIGPEISDPAAARYDDYLQKIGVAS